MSKVMSVLEIEKAVIELPLGERQYLAKWLVESLEDEEDETAARLALEEGGKTICWEQLKKEVGLDHEI